MVFVTVSSKGQIVLPSKTRHRLGLNVGAKLQLLEDSEGLHLKVVRAVSKSEIASLAGMVSAPRKGKPRSLFSFAPGGLLKRKRENESR